MTNESSKVVLGIDVGTSGIRACVVEKNHINNFETVLLEAFVDMPMAKANLNNEYLQPHEAWIKALNELLKKLSNSIDLAKITHCIVDATSSTTLLTNSVGTPISHAIMYNDSQSTAEAFLIEQLFEKVKLNQTKDSNSSHDYIAGITALSSSSSLAKGLRLNKVFALHNETFYIQNQVDIINQYLGDSLHITDENNALKMGFDSLSFDWPSWIKSITDNLNLALPKVVKPGSEIGKVKQNIADEFGFNKNMKILAGTTDSIAGFLATGAKNLGDTVVSLGSSIALKMIANVPVFSTKHGLYSHRLGNDWLIGGASNAGGKILAELYSTSELSDLTVKQEKESIKTYIKKHQNDYYPLSGIGERFPLYDNQLPPRLPNKPNTNYSQNLAESEQNVHKDYVSKISLGLANIELQALELLENLSQQKINELYSVGGGLKNQTWQQFRNELLNYDLQKAKNSNAAYGVTKLVQ